MNLGTVTGMSAAYTRTLFNYGVWQQIGRGSYVGLLNRYGLDKVNVRARNRSVVTKSGPDRTMSILGRYGKMVALGFGIGGVCFGGYIYINSQRTPAPIGNSSDSTAYYTLQQPPPYHEPARTVTGIKDNIGLKLTLYQYQTCPFCCKVRAFLDYYGFSYDVVEVNSVTRKETRWTDYRKVPFLIVEDKSSDQIYQLKDSSMIISALSTLINTEKNSLGEITQYYPVMSFIDESGKKVDDIQNRYSLMYGSTVGDEILEEIKEEKKWRKWVDDVLVHTLSPNVYRTMTEAFQAFMWFSEAGNWKEHFGTFERYIVLCVGPPAMYLVGKRLRKKYNLKDDVRASLYNVATVWTKALQKKKTAFMGGDKPNLSDLSVYGVLLAIEGCEAFQDLMTNTDIKPWFEGMKTVVNGREGSQYLSTSGRQSV